jgi:predicted RNA-binding Zn-ribbon protein involved in translation (DUF1610 family)
MTAKFSCAKCGHVYLDSPGLDVRFDAKDHMPCPKCGASNIYGEVSVEETFKVFDSMAMTARDAKGVIAKLKAGGSLSADGSVAQIEQVVDKRNRMYKKKVTLADGTVVKDVEGALDDQTLHGPKNKNG